jgi:poly-gamma-glutamate synthesis protein (capsule biosynthesis protein)
MVPYSLVFNSNPKYVERLQKAGFDILSSANNHAMDKGEGGLLETMNYVKGASMDSLGAGEDCHQGIVKEVKGIKLGFLGYSYTGYNSGGHAPSELVCDWNDFEKVKADVVSLKQKVDHVIVLPHTGIEYATEPIEEDKQKMQELIDLGASAIVGAHPHVVQSVDNYKEGVIAYSLGNFVFDNQENPETEKGLILELVFDKQKVVSAKKLSIRLKNFCCPELE